MALVIKSKPRVFKPNLQKNNKHIYNDPNWRGKDGLRALRLSNEPYCRICGKPATMVDHIDPINDGGKPFDYNNTQSMCDSCHSIKRQNERNLYK